MLSDAGSPRDFAHRRYLMEPGELVPDWPCGDAGEERHQLTEFAVEKESPKTAEPERDIGLHYWGTRWNVSHIYLKRRLRRLRRWDSLFCYYVNMKLTWFSTRLFLAGPWLLWWQQWRTPRSFSLSSSAWRFPCRKKTVSSLSDFKPAANVVFLEPLLFGTDLKKYSEWKNWHNAPL